MAWRELVLRSDRARAVLIPEEGGMVSQFRVGEREILAPHRHVIIEGRDRKRGGIPILFPQAHSLTEPQGEFSLPHHGFARDLPWEVVEASSDSARLRLQASELTRRMYPYDFEATLEVRLWAKRLHLDLRISNHSPRTMPVAPGLHPYFAVPAGAWSGIRTDIQSFDIAAYRLGETVFFPLHSKIELTLLDRLVRMAAVGAFVRPSAQIVVWSDNPEYLCLEVWSTGLNGLLHPGERAEVPSGGQAEFSLDIEVEG